ncbi:MAG: hypothetical protein UW58_C0004G0069 [Candidatus Collierbacteria bacterium GW2011_GWC2_44_30]|nr:MAG: hypothetical protein UW58_C0004G0069 [Candidatus Collierbacteria bacterium GW2011_GWC2_44_30]
MSVSADKLFALLAAEMAHIWTTTENFAGAGNFESFHDDFSRLLLLFCHSGYFFGLTWAIKSLPKNLGASTSVDTSDNRLIT